ncbi:beta-1,3-galactosyltransferase 1-like [Haliotis rufescens]|uniref:beta-1,3-galactosyltransferase 1-like n=1 Tax=Haliotis rufescens TaxID=6454 RepID=UPI00201FA8E2|nr:beta-1,3-galactosyltransferase 1-like [Haliotis rufescens]
MNTIRIRKKWCFGIIFAWIVLIGFLLVPQHQTPSVGLDREIKALNHLHVPGKNELPVIQPIVVQNMTIHNDRKAAPGRSDSLDNSSKSQTPYRLRDKLVYVHNSSQHMSPLKAVGKKNAGGNKNGTRGLLPFSFKTVTREYTELINWAYFTSKRDIILNSHSFSFSILPKQIKNEHPFLIIMVLSIARYHRTAIRQTYGSVANGQRWPGSNLPLNTKLIFLFGRTLSDDYEAVLKEESKIYGDILQGNFDDTFHNVTLKVLSGIKYVVEYYPDTQYVLKADDDTFTDVDRLVRLLKSLQPVNSVLGNIIMSPRVLRVGKRALTEDVYPFVMFPRYAAGHTYVLAMDLGKCIAEKAKFLPYVFIEDTFITGIMAAVCNATQYHVDGFSGLEEGTPFSIQFVKGRKISGNGVPDKLKHKIWKALRKLYP